MGFGAAMRVYHFVNEEFGLQDLQLQRIKIAKFLELNDPFELFSPCFADSDTRLTWRNIAFEIADTLGIICFSKDWHNPVQWSHYADRHRGFCMGFDIPDELLNHVQYKAKRSEANQIFYV